MRQSDGADLLGANHRRSADIGLIYVALHDDRQSVLAAILTQEKLGRKHIAVVLPERNSAFQRAFDFDELKTMRRGLQAQLVFVAPAGSGSVGFARQSRFPVYSSLEDYAQTLQDELQEQDTSDMGHVFGGRQTPARSPASTGAAETEEPPRALPERPIVSPLAERASEMQPEEQRITSDRATEDLATALSLAPPTPVPHTDEISQPANVSPQEDGAPVPASPAPQGAGENDGETGDSPPPSQGGPAGGLPVPVGASALVTPPYASYSIQGSSLAFAPRRSWRRWLIALPMVLALLVIGFFAYQPIMNLIVVPTATVTITPTSQDLSTTYTITAVTRTPDPAQHQVQARLLYSASSALAKTTVNASGVGHTPATIATGTLTFYNSSPSPVTIPAGMVFTTASGVEIVTARAASIPAGNPPTVVQTTVTAHAVYAGASGNIPTLAFNNVPCCANGVFVQNRGAFRGGQDQQSYTYVEQSDIDEAASALELSLAPGVQAALQQQIQAQEHLVSSPRCLPASSSDHAAGEQAATVTVTVMMGCTGEVYDQRAAQAMAQALLVTDPAQNPGKGYVLVGNITTAVTNATADTKGSVSLLVHAQGIWVYQFNTAQKQALVKLIAGKSQQVAQSLLLQQEGVEQTTIHLFGGNGSTLPTDQSQITLAVLSVQGLQGAGLGNYDTATHQQGPALWGDGSNGQVLFFTLNLAKNKKVPRDGIEPTTPAFSVLCSTN